jgi:3,4-dihydroxy-9,10-secoandrosta-1,3,5(10)-triene-9,17-dione 4,5-dioxygenase
MSVRSLGYVVIDTTDLRAWKEFAVDLLGLQVAREDESALVLRMDDKSYRLDIRLADQDGVAALGWEVGGPAELDALVHQLEAAGHAVKRRGTAEAQDRDVSGLATLQDPDGQEVHLFYGMKSEKAPFVSSLGHSFVTGKGGLGHVFQFISDTDAFDAFYFENLGFRLSDYIEFNGGQATFTHCNTRHHSMAFAHFPTAPPGVQHLMLEVDDMDAVGRAWDKVQDGAAPITSTLGKHTNDEMLSFYVTSPSGFAVEFGYGGLLVDDETWTPSRFTATSYWGHHRTDTSLPDV